MGFFLATLFFCICTLICFMLTVSVYFKIVKAVKHNEDVPMWIYKIGHALKGRGQDHYRNVTDAIALRQVNIFLIALLVANIVVVIAAYQKFHNVPESIFFCIKMEFFIVVALRVLAMVVMTGDYIFQMIRKKSGNDYDYASTNAAVGMVFMASFFLSVNIFLAGVPAKAIEVDIAKSHVVIGSTKASKLLKDGFEFYKKNPNGQIRNSRNNHFYYGELAELIRDGKSYGIVSLTPKWGDTAKLKDCVITYYGIHAQNKQIGEVKIEHRNLSKLRYDDFKNKKLTDIFSLKPPDYKESKGKFYFGLQLQTHAYMLWNRYTIEAKFDGESKPVQYEVRVQHTIWE